MGRPRTKDFDLPPRLYRRGTHFYYVGADKRWQPVGNDLNIAKRKWAEYECLGTGPTVRDLIWDYFDGKVRGSKRAAGTIKQYKAYANAIDKEWGRLVKDRLTRMHVAAWRDHPDTKPGWANGIITFGRLAYRWAAEREELPNPFDGIALNPMAVRDRYLDDGEFRAVWNAAPAWMRTAMDLAYLTGMRPVDVLALRWEQVGDATVTRMKKVKLRVSFAMTPEIAAVLAEARQRPVLGLYVVASNRGRKMSTDRWQTVMRGLCKRLGIEDATPRDIRAKAATDAEAAGLDYQAMLGHSSKRMSDRYLKLRRTVNAPTLAKRIK